MGKYLQILFLLLYYKNFKATSQYIIVIEINQFY